MYVFRKLSGTLNDVARPYNISSFSSREKDRLKTKKEEEKTNCDTNTEVKCIGHFLKRKEGKKKRAFLD